MKTKKAKQLNNESVETTPLMKQYNEVKAKYPDALLLFRVGDFYETFGSDAIKVSDILHIVLTSRNNGSAQMELAGFPYHSLDLYLPKLVRAGYRVAICDQLEKPEKGKKIVKRGVTNVVTPGLTIEDALLNTGVNNYLASVHRASQELFGLAFLDLSTGEFLVTEGNLSGIDTILQRFLPAEIIFSKGDKKFFQEIIQPGVSTFLLDDWIFNEVNGREKLLRHFNVNSLKGFGIDNLLAGQVAAGAILQYLELNENKLIGHITKITRIAQEDTMWMDKFTIHNLELLPDNRKDSRSLLEILDKCLTPMGSRMLKKWMLMPLLSRQKIERRQAIVQFFIESPELTKNLEIQFKKTGDLERIISKSAMGRIQPREILQLCRALEAGQKIKADLENTKNEFLNQIGDSFHSLVELASKIKLTIREDAPAIISKGNIVNDGVSKELDDYRYIIENNKQLMENILLQESTNSGVPNLKLGYNNVFGYYFEVTARHKQLQPPNHWIRKQTLTNAERYITEELKTLETKVIQAQTNIQLLEEQVYVALINDINEFIAELQNNCQHLATIDCLLSFANQAIIQDYCKPEFTDENTLEITKGRHPIIEVLYGHERQYIPNDLKLNEIENQILIITGPNMAGKSAILRQTGLIALMAQMGSYVPAAAVRMSIIDKLFTRVGASDNILGGESTFMVEMNETATIINNLSNDSLILLDEIGRGTSTYDGISIAWSLVEYLHDNPTGKPKTLFATHYHELNELEHKLDRVQNFKVAIQEYKEKVIFLYQLIPGNSEHSFGIHVARMAGLPNEIIRRATEVMTRLEDKSQGLNDFKIKDVLAQMPANSYQLSIFETSDPSIGAIRELLLELNPESMTPIECLIKLKELQNLAQASLVN